MADGQIRRYDRAPGLGRVGALGPPAIAELLSVCAAVAGVLLLGLVAAVGSASAVFSAAEEDDLRPVLIALPLVAFAAGTLISASIAFMIARGCSEFTWDGSSA